MSGIAVAGNALLDHYKVIDSYPAESALTTIRAVASAPGGLLCNCAIGLARLDPELRVPVVGIVGDDPDGDLLTQRLENHPGIDTAQLHRAGRTSFTDVMEDSATKTRTFFHFRGANADLDVDHFDLDQLDADLLHVGYVLLLDSLDREDAEYGTRMARLLAAARARGLRTSIDVVSEQSDRFSQLVPPALRYTDYCIVNELEASRTTGVDVTRDGVVDEERLRHAATALLDMGVSTWVIIHWPGGAVGLTSTGEWVTRPGVRLQSEQIVTTTGAGDAFAAGVLHAEWSGRSLGQALETGIGAAACSLLAGDATDGIKTHQEVLEFYRDSEHQAWGRSGEE
jgi:sugar/nucleoside kinase (ribokinase family)